MLILYGTQGGTSKTVARLLQNIIGFGYSEEYFSEIHPCSGVSSIIEMDKFDFKKIIDVDCIIFVCSTQGNGTEPFNMTRFWNMLKKIRLTDFLSHLNFAVFGLGDSSYESYNYCSKKLYNLLVRLGAKPIIRRGCGDSQDKEGWLTDFKPWCKELLGSELIKQQILEDSESFKSRLDPLYDVLAVSSNKMTPVDYKPSIIEIGLNIDDYESFKPGDCLGITPLNYNIEEIMEYTGIYDTRIEAYDFNGIPQIIFFSYLYQYIIDNKIEINEEKCTRIRELFKDYDFYHEYVYKTKRTYFETIQDLEIKLPLDFVLQYIPLISPRYFTLTKRNDRFYILASLVQYKTILKKERLGVCSEYLKGYINRIKCRIGKSLINIIKNKILIICTGAGISIANSLINFYEEKEFTVFYGFRFWDRDCIDKDIKNRENVKIYYASSRDDKQYVQDVFKNNPIENIKDYEVVIGGNSRLNKIVEKMFSEIYGEKIPFHSETW